MTDVDQILRDHADAAAAIDPAADGWDRLLNRLTEADDVDADDARAADGVAGPAGPRLDRSRRGAGRPGRWPLVAAAAVLVVVLASAAVALARAGDDDGAGRTGAGPADGSTEPAPTETTATVPASTTSPDAGTAPETSPVPTTSEPGTGRPDIDHDRMPDRVIAVLDHDGDGLDDLVRLEGLGRTQEVPGPGGTTATDMVPPEVTVLVPGSDVAPAAITAVDVGPDGSALYAVGEEVWGIEPASGLVAGPIAEGTAPAISGDGMHLATIVDGRVRLHDLEALWGPDHVDVPPDGTETTAVALSADGETVARQTVARANDDAVTSTRVEVASTADPTEWVEVERSSGVALPAFMPDGFLAVGLDAQQASVGQPDARAASVGMADLATGEVRWSVGGGGFSFTSFDATPDGRWVMVTQEGVIRAFAAVDGWLWDSGTVVALDGIVDAAW